MDNICLNIILTFLFISAAFIFYRKKLFRWSGVFFLVIFFIWYADYFKLSKEGVEFKRKLAEVKESIGNLNKAINEIYSNFIAERIIIDDLNNKFKIINVGDRNYFIFKLRYTPNINSLFLSWGIVSQPPDSYKVANNLLIFATGENLDQMKVPLYDRFIIRYFKNMKQGRHLELNDLEIKNGSYLIKSINQTFKEEDFLAQSVIFE